MPKAMLAEATAELHRFVANGEAFHVHEEMPAMQRYCIRLSAKDVMLLCFHHVLSWLLFCIHSLPSAAQLR